MKVFVRPLILMMFVAVSAAFLPSLASAQLVPYLSVSNNQNGYVQIMVYGGDPDSLVSLYTRQDSNTWTVVTNFGQTDNLGNYSVNQVIGNDGSGNPVQAYVTVSGTPSNIVSFAPITTVAVPYNPCVNYSYAANNCYQNTGGITLSQSNISMSTGQSQNITISSYNNQYVNGVSNSYYISSNTNNSVATVSVSGNSLNVYAENPGSTTITVCGQNTEYNNSYSNACATLYVTVNGENSTGGTISFSPANPVVNVGQSVTVTAYSGNSSYVNSNEYFISSNSNSSIASASVSGSVITINGLNVGSTTITVCGQNTVYNNSYSNSCAALYVTVNTYGNNVTTGTVTFSQTNPTLSIGQSVSISLSAAATNGYYNADTFEITNNSNSSVASASISGNTITIQGLNTGSTTMTVCANVNGYTSYSSYNNCGTLYVTVNSYTGNNTNAVTFSQTNPGIAIGQSINITLSSNYLYNSGYASTYYIGANSNPNVVSATVTGNVLNLYGISSGSTTLSVCSAQNSCSSLYVTVGSASTGYGCSTTQINYNYTCGSGGSVLGSSVYRSGTLVSDGGTIYILSGNTKTGFANFSAFSGLGYSLNNVQYFSTANIPLSGYVISSPDIAHPWGTWIKNGNTVYYVSQNGLIPVPDYATFLNNGGTDAAVVPANGYDWQKQTLSIMTYNDPRVQ